MSSKSLHNTACTTIWLACLACLGCGEDWQAETHPVIGRVNINGQAPEGAVVTLYTTGEKVDERNSRPWGVVQHDGSFTLTTYDKGDGAPVGTYKLTIKWPEDLSKPSTAMTDRLGGKFARPEQSQWTVTIEEGNNELELIEITGVKVQTKRHASPGKAPPMPGGTGAEGGSGR